MSPPRPRPPEPVLIPPTPFNSAPPASDGSNRGQTNDRSNGKVGHEREAGGGARPGVGGHSVPGELRDDGGMSVGGMLEKAVEMGVGKTKEGEEDRLRELDRLEQLSLAKKPLPASRTASSSSRKSRGGNGTGSPAMSGSQYRPSPSSGRGSFAGQSFTSSRSPMSRASSGREVVYEASGSRPIAYDDRPSPYAVRPQPRHPHLQIPNFPHAHQPYYVASSAPSYYSPQAQPHSYSYLSPSSSDSPYAYTANPPAFWPSPSFYSSHSRPHSDQYSSPQTASSLSGGESLHPSPYGLPPPSAQGVVYGPNGLAFTSPLGSPRMEFPQGWTATNSSGGASMAGATAGGPPGGGFPFTASLPEASGPAAAGAASAGYASTLYGPQGWVPEGNVVYDEAGNALSAEALLALQQQQQHAAAPQQTVQSHGHVPQPAAYASGGMGPYQPVYFAPPVPPPPAQQLAPENGVAATGGAEVAYPHPQQKEYLYPLPTVPHPLRTQSSQIPRPVPPPPLASSESVVSAPADLAELGTAETEPELVYPISSAKIVPSEPVLPSSLDAHAPAVPAAAPAIPPPPRAPPPGVPAAYPYVVACPPAPPMYPHPAQQRVQHSSVHANSSRSYRPPAAPYAYPSLPDSRRASTFTRSRESSAMSAATTFTPPPSAPFLPTRAPESQPKVYEVPHGPISRGALAREGLRHAAGGTGGVKGGQGSTARGAGGARMGPKAVATPGIGGGTRGGFMPKPPAHSPHALWVGNVPSDASHAELWNFFQTRAVPSACGVVPIVGEEGIDLDSTGIESIHLITRSNCAFVNYLSTTHLQHAIRVTNGVSLRPSDPKCKPFLCRERKSSDDTKSGVGAQRTGGMHMKYIREQRWRMEESQRVVAQHMSLQTPTIVGGEAELGVSPTGGGGARRQSVMSSMSGSTSIGSGSTTSSFLSKHFERRYFILKSHDEADLQLSVSTGLWATQAHNEPVLQQAFRTAKSVYLIFGANGQGCWFGYAKMTGPISSASSSAGSRPSWSSRGAETGTLSSGGNAVGTTSLSAASQTIHEEGEASDFPVRPPILVHASDPQFEVSSPSPFTASPSAMPSLSSAQLDGGGLQLGHKAPESAPATLAPHAGLVKVSKEEKMAMSIEADLNARETADNLHLPAEVVEKRAATLDDRVLYKTTTRTRTFSESERIVSEELGGARRLLLETEAERRNKRLEGIVDRTEEPNGDRTALSPGPHRQHTAPVHHNSTSSTSSTWGTSFAVEWIKVANLPFTKTRHIRNAFNGNREIKISRDGTEVEPTSGEALLSAFWADDPSNRPEQPLPSGDSTATATANATATATATPASPSLTPSTLPASASASTSASAPASIAASSALKVPPAPIRRPASPKQRTSEERRAAAKEAAAAAQEEEENGGQHEGGAQPAGMVIASAAEVIEVENV
ncbi:hypothetical protein JCM11641_001013 [Rhodosporidiobolus odoratus]